MYKLLWTSSFAGGSEYKPTNSWQLNNYFLIIKDRKEKVEEMKLDNEQY